MLDIIECAVYNISFYLLSNCNDTPSSKKSLIEGGFLVVGEMYLFSHKVESHFVKQIEKKEEHKMERVDNCLSVTTT